MQHSDGADLGAEMAAVGGDVALGLRRDAEQDTVDLRLVVEREIGHRRRHGEDNGEVGHRQQLGLARLEPFGARQTLAFRAMPIAAGIVGATNKPAIGTLLGVPAEHGRPARLDRRHDATRGAAEAVRVGLPVCRAVAAEDVRHLQHGAHRAGSGGRGNGFGDGATHRLQLSERAGGGAYFVGRET